MTTGSSRDWIRLGWIRRAHGLRGEVEVHLDWSESRSLVGASRVLLSDGQGEERAVDVVRARPTPKGILLTLAGVDDRTQAEALRGSVVGVLRQSLPALEEGEYYLSDLVGYEVVDADGRVGSVVELQLYPSVDAVVVELASGQRVEQPLLDEWLERVDLDTRTIVIRSRDGLIELPGSPREKSGVDD